MIKAVNLLLQLLIKAVTCYCVGVEYRQPAAVDQGGQPVIVYECSEDELQLLVQLLLCREWSTSS